MIDVEREPAPGSLARRTGWGGKDVRAALQRTFKKKCYLCESPLGRSWHVDHLKSRCAGGPEYEWGNLFPACPSCNMRRRRNWPAGGMLDPAGGDRVEERLFQELIVGVGLEVTTVSFEAADEGDAAAENTAGELQRLHNDAKHDDAHQLTQLIINHMTALTSRLTDALAEEDARERKRALRKLRKQLGPRGAYSALMRRRVREIVRSHQHVMDALGL